MVNDSFQLPLVQFSTYMFLFNKQFYEKYSYPCCVCVCCCCCCNTNSILGHIMQRDTRYWGLLRVKSKNRSKLM